MSQTTLTVALVTDVFTGPGAAEKLARRLAEARALGAELAVLPEVPLNAWVCGSKVAHDEDAEEPEGPRHSMMSDAARAAGIGLVGGVIRRDPITRQRHNTALVFSATGALLGTYAKLHLPDEPGFYEPVHWAPAAAAPAVIHGFALPLGVQICSDNYRPEGSHLLGALGAMLIVAPRATEAANYERWNVVFRANAMTSTAYVVSVNRPSAENGVLIGGPSLVVHPSGRVLLETTDPVAVVTLSRAEIEAAREAYPGYLAVRADVYARAWSDIAGSRS